jgi:hypothetical protein
MSRIFKHMKTRTIWARTAKGTLRWEPKNWIVDHDCPQTGLCELPQTDYPVLHKTLDEVVREL